MTLATPQRLVVVGASLAGLRAVEAARRTGYDGAISLVGAESRLPYDRPPLSKEFLHESARDLRPHTFRDEEFLCRHLNIDLCLGSEATALDPDSRQLSLKGERLSYSALIIATGASPRPLPCDGALSGVHTLRTFDDARRIRARLDEGAHNVVVIGAGFIGCEVAATVRQRGCRVTIVEAAPVPLIRAIGEQMGGILGRLHEREGVRILCGRGVVAIEGKRRVSGVRLTDGTSLKADLVVIGIGAQPATDWLADSGLELNDGVVCDETLAAGARGVYAAGDVARWPNRLFDVEMRLEHWTAAAEQAAIAARNALSPATACRFETVPYFWSDWYHHRIQFVGVPTADEVRIVVGDVDRENLLALYRRGDRIVGALGLNQRKLVTRVRSMIARKATWAEGLQATCMASTASRIRTGINDTVQGREEE